LMALDFFSSEENEGRTHMLVSVASEIFMVCAVVLLFFVHLELSQLISAAGALAAMFLGSLFIWKSYNGAKLVLLFSLVVIQLVLLKYAAILMLPFTLIDVLIIVLIISSWKSNSD
jgi:hypothetical protein